MSTMDKVKDALHIRRKSKPDNSDIGAGSGAGAATSHTATTGSHQHPDEDERNSFDSELAAMTPAEREAYLKEFDEADTSGEPKKGSLLEKLIARGNKKTEDDIMQEHAARQAAQGQAQAGAAQGGVIR